MFRGIGKCLYIRHIKRIQGESLEGSKALNSSSHRGVLRLDGTWKVIMAVLTQRIWQQLAAILEINLERISNDGGDMLCHHGTYISKTFLINKNSNI